MPREFRLRGAALEAAEASLAPEKPRAIELLERSVESIPVIRMHLLGLVIAEVADACRGRDAGIPEEVENVVCECFSAAEFAADPVDGCLQWHIDSGPGLRMARWLRSDVPRSVRPEQPERAGIAGGLVEAPEELTVADSEFALDEVIDDRVEGEVEQRRAAREEPCVSEQDVEEFVQQNRAEVGLRMEVSADEVRIDEEARGGFAECHGEGFRGGGELHGGDREEAAAGEDVFLCEVCEDSADVVLGEDGFS